MTISDEQVFGRMAESGCLPVYVPPVSVAMVDSITNHTPGSTMLRKMPPIDPMVCVAVHTDIHPKVALPPPQKSVPLLLTA